MFYRSKPAETSRLWQLTVNTDAKGLQGRLSWCLPNRLHVVNLGSKSKHPLRFDPPETKRIWNQQLGLHIHSSGRSTSHMCETNTHLML